MKGDYAFEHDAAHMDLRHAHDGYDCVCETGDESACDTGDDCGCGAGGDCACGTGDDCGCGAGETAAMAEDRSGLEGVELPFADSNCLIRD